MPNESWTITVTVPADLSLEKKRSLVERIKQAADAWTDEEMGDEGEARGAFVGYDSALWTEGPRMEQEFGTQWQDDKGRWRAGPTHYLSRSAAQSELNRIITSATYLNGKCQEPRRIVVREVTPWEPIDPT